MIDLHIHSTYSDGSDSVKDILMQAEKLNLDLISITDHNSVDANVLLLNDKDLRNTFSGKIIPGCEVLSVYKDNFVEVLGYIRDVEKFKTMLIDPFSIQNLILEQYICVSRKLGLNLDIDRLQRELIKREYTAMGVFVRELVKNPEYSRCFGLEDNPCSRFYNNFYLNSSTPFYVNERRFYKTTREVIKDIHECGGVAVLAHPFQYPAKNQKEFIEDLIGGNSFDGVECEYPTFDKSQRDYLKFLCRYYGFVLSGGSDYHGSNRILNKMGTGINDNLNIPYDMVSDWTKPLEKVLIYRK